MSDTRTLSEKHFTPENMATLSRAYDVLCQISYEMGELRDPHMASKDAAAITLAETAASTLSKLLSLAQIRYHVPVEYGAPGGSRVTAVQSATSGYASASSVTAG